MRTKAKGDIAGSYQAKVGHPWNLITGKVLEARNLGWSGKASQDLGTVFWFLLIKQGGISEVVPWRVIEQQL